MSTAQLTEAISQQLSLTCNIEKGSTLVRLSMLASIQPAPEDQLLAPPSTICAQSFCCQTREKRSSKNGKELKKCRVSWCEYECECIAKYIARFVDYHHKNTAQETLNCLINKSNCLLIGRFAKKRSSWGSLPTSHISPANWHFQVASVWAEFGNPCFNSTLIPEAHCHKQVTQRRNLLLREQYVTIL